MANEDTDGRAQVVSRVIISKDELPLTCPMPSMSLWNMHPKVALALDENHEAVCPYCGTHYQVQGDI